MPDELTKRPDETGPVQSADDPSSSERPGEISLGRWLLELVVLVGLAFVLAQGVKTYIVQPFIIPSASMQPTLDIGDRVLVAKFAYRLTEPKVGDVVVFRSPQSDKLDFIKRVVAVGGQTVDVRDDRLVVDGKPVLEPFTAGAATRPGAQSLPIRVPAGTVFLMGDNRLNSTDSRWFGPQPVSNIRGKAFFIYWPPRDAGSL